MLCRVDARQVAVARDGLNLAGWSSQKHEAMRQARGQQHFPDVLEAAEYDPDA